MKHAAQSRYIRYHNKSDLIRRWIATILLQSDLKTQLMFSGLDPVITRGFDTTSLTRDNAEDADFVRAWLEDELSKCGDDAFDESDVFAINTRRIQKSMGLKKVELAVLRFACLLACYKPLETAAEAGTREYTEADVCDLLAELLRLPFGSIYEALRPAGLLRTSGLLRSGNGWAHTQHLNRWLLIPDMLAREIFRAQDEDNLLINVFYTAGPKSSLTQHDFPQRSELALLKNYFRASIRDKAVGANVLIWGPPGTGKTEMARHIAQALRRKSLEINSIGIDGQALSAADRLDNYRFCQAILARSSNAIVTFDEVEEVLSNGGFSRFGFRDKSDISKGLINKILETNRTPAIWITNTVDGVDPAYLRRFDIITHLDTPVRLIKKKLAWRAFKDVPMKSALVDRMVRHESVTPAHMTKVTRICKRVGVETPEHAARIATQVLNGDLKAVCARPLEPGKRKRKTRIALPYRPSLINCDTDIERLTANLSAESSVRICCFGPPGTGKTAWARHLAESVCRPLLVKPAADILDKYIGGTEENIAGAFREATASNSVLMIDEVDSFLPDRANASRHWEITQANQFLTSIEEFDGILVCATNLMESLDPATMRRFDFKVHFEYLQPEQSLCVAADLLEVLGINISEPDQARLAKRLGGMELSFGDFAALLRRYSLLQETPSIIRLLHDLDAESAFRSRNHAREIGFTAKY